MVTESLNGKHEEKIGGPCDSLAAAEGRRTE